MNNPYHAPTADLSHAGADVAAYEPSVFSFQGRIGRVRYFAYTWLYFFIAFFGLAVVLGMGVGFGIARPELVQVLAIVAYVPIIGISMIPSIRRLNDLNRSGWWSLLGLVPLVNIGFGIWVLFFPGDSDVNRYGPAPAKNSLWLILGALSPVLFAGFIAALAIPQYQMYVERARARQAQPVTPAELPSQPARPQQ